MALYLWGVAEVLGLFVSSKSLVSTITAEQIFHKTSFLSAGVPVWYLQGIDILLCLFYSGSPGLLLVFLLAMINAMIFRVMGLVMDLFSATRNVKNYIQCLNSNSTRYKEIPPPPDRLQEATPQGRDFRVHTKKTLKGCSKK